MTYKQKEQFRQLEAKIVLAYNAWQANTNKDKAKNLSKAWINAIDRAEKFSAKFGV